MGERITRRKPGIKSSLASSVLRLGRGKTTERLIEKELRALRRFLRQGRQLGGSARRFGSGRGHVRLGGYSQRVVVKARVVKNKEGQGGRSLKKHISYLCRSGVSLDGTQADFFNHMEDLTREQVREITKEWVRDRHHFRFIISPERSSDLNLKEYARQVALELERDLKTKLNWVATCHYNTDNPHIHLLLRGVDGGGETLFISKDYIKHGFRLAAEKEATRVLGQRTLEETRKNLKRDVTLTKVTALDIKLLKEQERSVTNSVVISPLSRNAREWEVGLRKDKLSRLQFLSSLGLAREVGTSRYRLSEKLIEALQGLGKRKATQERIEKALKGRLVSGDFLIYDSEHELKHPLRGEVLGRGLIDEISEKSFLLLSGDDGKLHYLPLSAYSEPEGFEAKLGGIVQVNPVSRARADITIEREARSHGGIFFLETFRKDLERKRDAGRFAPPAGLTLDGFLERFETRLNTLSEAGVIERSGEKRWSIPVDFETRVQKLDQRIKRERPIEVTSLSVLSLSEQINRRGVAWIDNFIEKPKLLPDPRTEFGKSIHKSVESRRKVLLSRGVVLARGFVKRLKKREELALKRKISKTFGSEIRFKAGMKARAVVSGYRVVGGEYRVVVRRRGDFALLPVGPRERRLEVGTEVQLEVRGHGANGALRVEIRPLETEGLGAGRKRGV